MTDEQRQDESKAKRWVKRVGFWGIVFFTVKGMITLTLGILAVYFAW